MCQRYNVIPSSSFEACNYYAVQCTMLILTHQTLSTSTSSSDIQLIQLYKNILSYLIQTCIIIIIIVITVVMLSQCRVGGLSRVSW